MTEYRNANKSLTQRLWIAPPDDPYHPRVLNGLRTGSLCGNLVVEIELLPVLHKGYYKKLVRGEIGEKVKKLVP